ncbi:carrier protein (macronuclear) [Tetrahymena thermophila SB210]|uniref:Carrier protein n=1 Tax=Tetrahymena thermophila (strain SB210) TaxID=312017 RepID=I7M7Y7_TETTS|nr:carrier protein [Tetrahymena thermophila SB210]EAR96278.1 carrier protein [Tetrahymena thermophila SB210]|eukprot:XP_001016523.1 carrier protein [Tetrahymena thermophila SB210]
MADNREKVDSRKLYEDQKLLDILEQRSLQQDQSYREIYKKSHILQKQSQFQDDKIVKQSELDDLLGRIKKVEKLRQESKSYTWKDPQYYHAFIRKNLDLASNLTMETICLLVCYPFNTIKTRVQAKHPLEDISFFTKNNVSKYPLYRGIGQGMLGTFIGVTMNNAAYRWINIEMMKNQFVSNLSTFQKQLMCFCFADLLAAPFRLPFEVRKIYLQMNSGEISFNKYMNGMRSVLLPCLLRDLTYRIGFNTVFQLCLHGQNYAQMYSNNDPYQRQLIQRHIDRAIPNQSDYNKRITGMILGSLFAILISNPFDLAITRLVSQQYPKYDGFFHCLKTVIREEKWPKLFFSGYWARSVYYMISGSIVFNFYDTFRGMIEEAYQY